MRDGCGEREEEREGRRERAGGREREGRRERGREREREGEIERGTDAVCWSVLSSSNRGDTMC